MNSEPLTQCRRVEEMCLDRILQIERLSDPSDSALQALLGEIETKERAQLEDVARFASSGGHADPEFPAARESLGEAPLNRENAMYHLENLKAEAVRFHEGAAREAVDEATREACARLALAGAGLIIRLRTVLL